MANQEAIDQFIQWLKSIPNGGLGNLEDMLRHSNITDADVAKYRQQIQQGMSSRDVNDLIAAVNYDATTKAQSAPGQAGVSRETPPSSSAASATPTAPGFASSLTQVLGGAYDQALAQQGSGTVAPPSAPSAAAAAGAVPPTVMLPHFLQQGYNSYLQQFQVAQGNAKRLGEDVSGVQPMAYADWQTTYITANRQPIEDAIIGALNTQYNQAHGADMPQPEQDAIKAKLASAGPNALAQVQLLIQAQQGDPQAMATAGLITQQQADILGLAKQAAAGDVNAAQQLAARTNTVFTIPAQGDPTPLAAQFGKQYLDSQSSNLSKVTGQALSQVTGLGFISGAQTDYETAHPDPAKLRAALDAQIFASTGNHVSDAELTRILALPGPDQQRAIGALPYGKTGIPTANYQQAQSTMDGYYSKYFGGAQAPVSDVVWAAGKNEQEIQDHVMNSPSKLDPAITVSTFTTMKGALDKYYQADYGHQAPDELLKDFHSVYGAAKAGQ